MRRNDVKNENRPLDKLINETNRIKLYVRNSRVLHGYPRISLLIAFVFYYLGSLAL